MTGVGEQASVGRGQTLQDFTFGIGVFIITVSAVLTAFFGYLGPFSAGVDGADLSQSERVTEQLVHNHSTGQQPNELNVTRLNATFTESDVTLRDRWGLDPAANFNVTLSTLNGSVIAEHDGYKLAAGAQYDNRSAATNARIVTLSDGSCDPSCRLIVRTW